MTHLALNRDLLSELEDKVVVLTGGAAGIGQSAIELFIQNGAKVVFGDIQDHLGEDLAHRLGAAVTFVHCDTSSYTDQLRLFEKAYELYRQIDIVVANAGVVDRENIFGPASDWTKQPQMGEIDVNLKGVLYTARIGAAYLRKNKGGDIILVSSISGFKESPGLPVYTAGKHGVVGIVRGYHLNAIKENIRINVICPWMTKTAMAKPLEEGWMKNKLPSNEASDIAETIAICATANRGDGSFLHKGVELPFAGKIVWVGGGKSYEIEDRIQALEPQWLGRENSSVLARGQEYLAQFGFS